MPESSHVAESSSRAWYGASRAEFLGTDSDTIVGRLTRNSDFTVLPAQRDAWLQEVCLLQNQLAGLTGSLFLEFSIPRMGRRIDAVLLIHSLVFVVEFKVGGTAFDRAALDQTWDYALDLKNFHEASHLATIIPILIATGAGVAPPLEWRADADKVYRPISVHAAGFRVTLDLILNTVKGEALDEQYGRAPLIIPRQPSLKPHAPFTRSTRSKPSPVTTPARRICA